MNQSYIHLQPSSYTHNPHNSDPSPSPASTRRPLIFSHIHTPNRLSSSSSSSLTNTPPPQPSMHHSNTTTTSTSSTHLTYYDNWLLTLAVDLGERLLPAFSTVTGIPYGTVNLRSGVPIGESVICVYMCI